MNPVRYCPWWTGAEAVRVRGELERVALGVGVRLLGKGWGGGPLTPVRGRGKRRGPGSVSSVGDGLHSVRSMSPEQGTVRRKLFDADSAKRATVTNGLLTPPPTVKKKNGKWKSQSETDIPVPSIAFRAFNHQSQGLNGAHGFVAGTFVHSSSIPDEPPAEPEYIQELWRHLEKQHSGPTPFISVSPYLMRVVMHAFRRDRELGQRTEWSVAVIALSKVRADVKAVWGVGAAGWNARRAFGEWVVHGHIPASNVLCVVPLAHLVATMSATAPPFHIDELRVATNLRRARAAMAAFVNRKLTFEDGVAVGRVLLCLGIPKRDVDEVTGAMMRDWRFPEGAAAVPGRKKGKKGAVVEGGGEEGWRGNGGFLRGREEGFGGMGLEGFWELGEGVKEEEEEEEAVGVGDGEAVQAPAGDGATFWGFLEELEVAAFGVVGVDGLSRWGLGEDEAAFEVKEESPDCLGLESMKGCPEG
ncbi:MAG: hypothetical protein LQ349_009344 [Xanthoria aureola]|nr:MAG: hypothetical protein LQ349_009344 [Xanthoria aureola]